KLMIHFWEICSFRFDDICIKQKSVSACAFGKKTQLRHEVAYFDCSAEVLCLCLNPASCRCDPMEACAHGASMMGMKPS
ncbi:MAG: hypothetical protein PVJ87_05755, partial [Desulfobacterales bacterium]